VETRHKDVNIALVYLGNEPPRYLGSNLNHLKNIFPTSKVWLITDSKKIAEKFKKTGQKTWLLQNSSDYWTEISERLNFPIEFRKGVWFLTIKRFKAIEKFMSVHPGPLLHIEADVLLMPDFPIKYFTEIKKCLAFPIVGNGNAIASVFFVQNQKAICDFNDYIESAFNGNSTDMTLLYDYQEKFPERVELLPSGPSSQGNIKGYFDGAAFGTFLLGQDPRNLRGISLKYSVVDWHADKMDELDFQIEGLSLMSISKGHKVPIFSLHVHSKRNKFFNTNGILKALNVAIKEYKLGPKKVLVPDVLPLLIYLAIRRRVRKILTRG
jgi:hypothetical protein